MLAIRSQSSGGQPPAARRPLASRIQFTRQSILGGRRWTLVGTQNQPPGGRNSSQDRPEKVKMFPRAPNSVARAPQERPKSAQERPKSAQERPRAPHERPRTGQEAPKVAPEDLEGRPEGTSKTTLRLKISKKLYFERAMSRDPLERRLRSDF